MREYVCKGKKDLYVEARSDIFFKFWSLCPSRNLNTIVVQLTAIGLQGYLEQLQV